MSENDTPKLAQGSCFWGHKWTVWKQYEQPFVLTEKATGRQIPSGVQFRQSRQCVRCGFVEDSEYKHL